MSDDVRPDGNDVPPGGEFDAGPLTARREGHTIRLSGTVHDAGELGQVVAAAEAVAGVDEVDVDDVVLEQPDSGLWT